jgi:phosphate transport system protein
VLQAEARINHLQIAIDEKATKLLALEQPVARDLRFIAAVIKINNDLERMGDEAVNIAERATSLMRELPVSAPIDIPHMAGMVQSMVRKALDSFVQRDAALARSVLKADDMVDELWHRSSQDLLVFMQKEPGSVIQCVNLIFITYNLERVADHATNIAEDVIYYIQGVDVRHHTEDMK